MTEDSKTGLEEAERQIEAANRSSSVFLDLSGLGLRAIPDSLAELANLEELYLLDNQINVIPDSLARLANLQELYLYNNQISAIPDSFARLANLQRLYLFSNQISAIPDSLARLANLQELYLLDNQIGTIPDSLAELANLEGLNLSRNQISAIPDSLARLANLQQLALSYNQISAVPDSLARLANLQELDLSHNQISAIPDSLARLGNLQRLYLSHNQISAIPNSLVDLKALTHLLLHGNPELEVPHEVLGPDDVDILTGKRPKPPREILEYYFTQRTGARPLNEAKLILVGRGGAGKTSLVKALTTGKFNAREKTTEGIKITDWACRLNRKDEVTLHIWDFGGQEMMHATHQFFLTARSLYLLVLNRRQGGNDEEADYWLRLIRAFGGKDAAVVVILNKQHSEPFDVNRGGWMEKYPDNIKAFVETDCTDRSSITRLKKKVQEQLCGLKSLKASFPTRWFAIKNELATMGSDYVTFEAYREICRKHGEFDAESRTPFPDFYMTSALRSTTKKIRACDLLMC